MCIYVVQMEKIKQIKNVYLFSWTLSTISDKLITMLCKFCSFQSLNSPTIQSFLYYFSLVSKMQQTDGQSVWPMLILWSTSHTVMIHVYFMYKMSSNKVTWNILQMLHNVSHKRRILDLHFVYNILLYLDKF